MVPAHIHPAAVLECLVVLFQVVGVAGLCLSRLLPATVWAARGRIGYLMAMLGLAVAGALCSQHNSEFALFAGGTMTVLLIGMTSGAANNGNPLPVVDRVVSESPLIA